MTTQQAPNNRVLISTIEPISGGVPTMTRFIVDLLVDRGLTPVLAHYEPYSRTPELSVPSFKLGRGRPGAERRLTWGDIETHAIGAWLPELEFTHYWPTAPWRDLMASCAAHVAVSGNVLPATPYLRTGRPYVAWVATGWDEDRHDRTAAFPWPRKLLDRHINAPVIRHLESRLLRAGSTGPGTVTSTSPSTGNTGTATSLRTGPNTGTATSLRTGPNTGNTSTATNTGRTATGSTLQTPAPQPLPTVLALSAHTRRVLETLAGGWPIAGILPMPVATDYFSPRQDTVVPGRIGFSGRLEDPRKNIGLLLEAMALANQGGANLSALLIGGPATPEITQCLQALGLQGQVDITPYVPREQLRDYLRTLDVFVVPSHQEGLCIAALEAMACGCPVVATPCGGPEEFVIAGETGQRVDFDPADLAQALTAIVRDRERRQRLAAGARRRIEQHYHRTRAASIFWHAFDTTFPALSSHHAPPSPHAGEGRGEGGNQPGPV